MIEMEINMVRLDTEVRTPLVILKEKNSKSSRILPIWIGLFEAVAIITELENQPVTRPMTHDLLKSVIDHLGAEVISVLVSDLKDTIFYAEISLRMSDGKVTKIDSRPSDAMALALRAKVPIYVSEDVMSRSAVDPEAIEADAKDHLKAVLEDLDADDFGKFKV